MAVILVDCKALGNANAGATTAAERKKGIALMEPHVKKLQETFLLLQSFLSTPYFPTAFVVAALICKRTAFKDSPPQKLECSLHVYHGRPDVAGGPFSNVHLDVTHRER